MKWSSVRIESSTLSRLQRYRDSVQNQLADGRLNHPYDPEGDTVSLNDAVNMLLDHKYAHRQRSKMQNKGRQEARKRKAAQSPTGLDVIVGMS